VIPASLTPDDRLALVVGRVVRAHAGLTYGLHLLWNELHKGEDGRAQRPPRETGRLREQCSRAVSSLDLPDRVCDAATEVLDLVDRVTNDDYAGRNRVVHDVLVVGMRKQQPLLSLRTLTDGSTVVGWKDVAAIEETIGRIEVLRKRVVGVRAVIESERAGEAIPPHVWDLAEGRSAPDD
jgi:hypothetical protein